jgi:hypothetical protein
MKIWTRAYRPFLMGGNVNAPIICDVPVSGPFDIGGGQQGYLAVSPKGHTFVAESVTGAIVGSTIKDVKTDIATADPPRKRAPDGAADEPPPSAAQQCERLSEPAEWRRASACLTLLARPAAPSRIRRMP